MYDIAKRREDGMTLKLNGIEVDCIIGDRSDERVRTQRLAVYVELGVGERVCDTDELSDTVDYAALTEKIRSALVEAKCRMIERAAKIVRGVCAAERGVDSVRVRVVKPGAIPHLESAEVVL